MHQPLRHSSPLGQLWQLAPPEPHQWLEVPARQVLAVSQQPPQLLAVQGSPQPSSAPLHFPEQLETQVARHSPSAQKADPEPHILQLTPPVPQALELVPGRHFPLPSQQPGQELVTHGLPQPLSSPTHFPSQLGVQVITQEPPLQACSPEVQTAQACPAYPQAPSASPARQVLALSQQPGQVLAVQVPPTPSGAPAHFDWQLGWS